MIKLDRFTPRGQLFLRELAKLETLNVAVGFIAGETVALRRVGKGSKQVEETETDIADVAMWNEYGTDTIPARPFFRDSVKEINSILPAWWKNRLTKIMAGEEAEQSMNELGSMAVGKIQYTILKGSYEPNMPSTIARKGSSHPLIDTGRMRQSVHYVVLPIKEGLS